MAVPVAEGDRPAETVAGFLAATALFAGLVALVYRPARIAPAAIVVALIASAIGGRYSRLSALAVAVSAVCFVAGMTIAVVFEKPLF
jgi:hypothetical protein